MGDFKNFVSVIIVISVISLAVCNSCGGNKRTEKQPVSENVIVSEPETVISIYEAAMNGQANLVTDLLEKSSDVNSIDEDGRTALMYYAGKLNNQL